MSKFAEGQVWTYRTRPGEESSRAIVTRVDADGLGNIVHVRLVGLRVQNPSVSGGLSEEISHMPFAEAAVAASVVAHVADTAPLADNDEGYMTWQEAFGQGRAGIFTVTLAEAVSLMETALSQ